MCVCVHASAYAWLCEKDQMAGWGRKEGVRGQDVGGLGCGGRRMGGAKTVLPCAPLAHVKRNCS